MASGLRGGIGPYGACGHRDSVNRTRYRRSSSRPVSALSVSSWSRHDRLTATPDHQSLAEHFDLRESRFLEPRGERGHRLWMVVRGSQHVECIENSPFFELAR